MKNSVKCFFVPKIACELLRVWTVKMTAYSETQASMEKCQLLVHSVPWKLGELKILHERTTHKYRVTRLIEATSQALKSLDSGWQCSN